MTLSFRRLDFIKMSLSVSVVDFRIIYVIYRKVSTAGIHVEMLTLSVKSFELSQNLRLH